jgi:hypothetical protein
MPDTVPKNPGNIDATLTAVLELIKFRNDNQRVLTEFSVNPNDVTLTFTTVP